LKCQNPQIHYFLKIIILWDICQALWCLVNNTVEVLVAFVYMPAVTQWWPSVTFQVITKSKTQSLYLQQPMSWPIYKGTSVKFSSTS
jgi:hypothetical protein